MRRTGDTSVSRLSGSPPPWLRAERCPWRLFDLWALSRAHFGLHWDQAPSQVPERSLEPRPELSPDVRDPRQVIIAGNGKGSEQSVQTGLAPFWYFSYFVDLLHSPAKDLPCVNLYSLRNERLDTVFCLFYLRAVLLSPGLGSAGLSTGPPVSSPRGADWGSRDAWIKLQSTFRVHSQSMVPAIPFSTHWHPTNGRCKRRTALQFLIKQHRSNNSYIGKKHSCFLS